MRNNIILQKIFLFLGISILSLACTAHAKERITLYADYWCPYNCIPNTNYEGLLIEVARYAFNKHNIEVEYKLEPWTKVVKNFNKNEIDGIVGAGIEDVGEYAEPVKPVLKSTMAAFTLDNTSWFYDEPDSLQNKVVGIIKSYTYTIPVNRYIQTTYISNPDLFYVSTADEGVKDNMEKLLKGEIFTYIEDEAVVQHYNWLNKISSVRKASILGDPAEIYILFPKYRKNSAKYASYITEAVREMKEKGMLEKLEEKYFFDKENQKPDKFGH